MRLRADKKCVSGKIKGCYKEVLREKFSTVFYKSFKGVSRKIEGCFRGVFSGLQGYLKEFQRKSFKFARVFQESLKDVLKIFLGVSRVF